MTVGTIVTAIAPILVLVLVGIALRRFHVLERGDSRVLNGVIIYAALPALIFTVVVKAPLSLELLRVVGLAWAVTLIALGIAWGVARLLRLSDAVAGGFILAAAIGNTGYIGYPVVRALLGDRWLPPAIFYDVFGSVTVMLVFGIMIAAHYGEHREGRVNIFKEFITFPAVVAVLVALVFRLVPWPEIVSSTVTEWTDFAGRMAAPLIMVSLGVSLDFKAFRGASASLGALTGIKLLVMPALVLVLAGVFGAGESVRMAAIEAGMPSALLAFIISERFGLDSGYVAAATLTTTVCCMLTIPLVQLLIR